MDSEKLFITEKKVYYDILKMIGKVFRIDNEFPGQVFQENYNDYLFEEFDWLMSSESWEVIKSLAQRSNDENIILAVLDPKPINYFYKEFGYFNWGKLPINLTDEEYFKFLEFSPKDSIADSILYNSNIVLWTSPSLKWGIFGQRDYETCVLAFNKESHFNDSLQFLRSWHKVEESLALWVPNTFQNQKIPKVFSNNLLKNYRNIQ